MRRSTLFPIIGVVIALAVLWFIFSASRPDETPVESGDDVGVVAEDPGALGLAEDGAEDE